MAKAKTTKSTSKTIAIKKSAKTPAASAKPATPNAAKVSQDPATPDDVAHAASLGRAPTDHFEPPGLTKASVFAEADTQKLLLQWSTKLTEDTGVDIKTFAGDAVERANSGLRVQRLVDSANREYAYYKALSASVTAEESQIKETLRGYGDATPIKIAFKNVLSLSSSAAGMPKGKVTRRKKAKSLKTSGSGTK